MRRSIPDGDPDLLGAFRGSTSTLTSSALRHAHRTGRIVRIRRDLYVDADLWNADDTSPEAIRNRLRIASVIAVAAAPRSRASHRSASVLAGIPLWSWTATLPCLTVPPSFDSMISRAHLHRARLPAEHLDSADPRRTAAARTILDLAREHGLRDAVVAGDHALRHGLPSAPASPESAVPVGSSNSLITAANPRWSR